MQQFVPVFQGTLLLHDPEAPSEAFRVAWSWRRDRRENRLRAVEQRFGVQSRYVLRTDQTD